MWSCIDYFSLVLIWYISVVMVSFLTLCICSSWRSPKDYLFIAYFSSWYSVPAGLLSSAWLCMLLSAGGCSLQLEMPAESGDPGPPPPRLCSVPGGSCVHMGICFLKHLLYLVQLFLCFCVYSWWNVATVTIALTYSLLRWCLQKDSVTYNKPQVL